MRDPGTMPGNLVMEMKTSLISGGIVYRPDTQHAFNAMFVIPKGRLRPRRAPVGDASGWDCDIITGSSEREKTAASSLDEIQQLNDSLIFVHFLISSVNEQFDQAEL